MKRKFNKSQLIRDYHAANPSDGPSAIARALGAQGHKVSIALVSQALRGLKLPSRPRGRPRKTPIAAKVTEGSLVGQMILAAEFSRACGGIESGIVALQSLQKIQSRMAS